MTTGRLLWGMTWRGGAWGAYIGIILSAIYGALVLIIFTIGMLFSQQYSLSLQNLFSILWAIFLGAVLGIMFGLPMGLSVGIANGFLLGTITWVCFQPMASWDVYKRVVAMVSALFTFVGACIAVMWLYNFLLKTSSQGIGTVIFEIVPALIAGGGAAYVSQRLARWYEHESTKGNAQNVASN